VLAGEPVEAVVADHLIRIDRRDVLVAEHVQRRRPDTGDRKQEVRLRQGSRRPWRDAVTVSRVVDSSGYVSFVHQLPGRQRLTRAAAPKSASTAAAPNHPPAEPPR
jgi:hypothetical protein